MADASRVDDLRQRLESDPASVAFAALAEHYRRAGQHQDAVATARAGLEHHPSYVSARVTLARALIDLGRPDEARIELEGVLALAPENLVALRELGRIHQHAGDRDRALAVYRRALEFARQDPQLIQVVDQLERETGGGGANAGPAMSAGEAGALPRLERFLSGIVAARTRRRSSAPDRVD